MTKKHFIALADAIKSHLQGFTPEQVETLANFCESQNSRFDRRRWIAYIKGQCGPNGSHAAIGVGFCEVCGHYGSDCTGKRVKK